MVCARRMLGTIIDVEHNSQVFFKALDGSGLAVPVQVVQPSGDDFQLVRGISFTKTKSFLSERHDTCV
jgi:hypothetical protein